MPGIQKYVLQFVGSIYIFRVLFKLAWSFVSHPVQHFHAMKKKPPLENPECLADQRYGIHEFIKLSEVKLHYVISGNEDKPLMLFLHGFPDFWYTWRHQIVEFSKNYRTVAVDMRGFGDSDEPTEITAYSTIKLREDIANLVKALNYKSCILVAHDIGGTTAFHVATKFPEIVDKLIILNCPHPAPFLQALKTKKSQKVKSWYMILFQVPYIPEMILKVFDYEFLREMCDGKLGSGKSDEEQQAYRFMYSRNGFTGQLNFYRAALSYRTTDTVSSEINTPTLIIWGSCDTFMDTEMAEMNRKYIPNMKIKYICNAGHWPHIDTPNEVNSAIHEFLNRAD